MEISKLEKKVYDNIFITCDHSVRSIKNMIIRVNNYNNKKGEKPDGSEIRKSK